MTWTPTETVRAAGEAARVAYDGAPDWEGPPPADTCGTNPGCAGGLTAGARTLGTYLQRWFPRVQHVGGYCCRPDTAAPSKMSVHGTGRALDVHFPLIDGRANPAGAVLAAWLVTHAAALGVQRVIWDRVAWSGSGRWASYTGPSPHTDHVHLEITREAAARAAPWYRDGGPERPPDLQQLDHQADDRDGTGSLAVAASVLFFGLAVAHATRRARRGPRPRAWP